MNAGTLSERLSAKDDPEGRRGTMAISLAGEDCGWKLTRAQEDHRPRQRLSRTQQKAAGPARWTAAQHKHRWPDEASPNVSQGGRGAAKSSSIRQRSELNIRKSSYGPSPADLLAVLS